MHPGRTSLMTLSGHSEQLTKHQLGVLHTSLFMEKYVISRLSLSTKPIGPYNMQTLIFKLRKTKRLHDSEIKDHVFNNGDRILLFNSRLKIFFGKLKSRWSGPFTISYVYLYGTVELSQPDGPNFKVNGYRVKHYFGEDILLTRVLVIFCNPTFSPHLIFDVYDDNFLEVESDAGNVYDDPVDSKAEKIKESKLLIDELDLPCDFLPPFEYDSFISQDFSRVDALPLTNNEDKVFNPSILIQEKPIKTITRVVQDKKLAISNASLVLEDFDPPFYEPFFFKEVPKSKMLLLFSSENEEKVFKPGIHTSEKVHSYFILELSHQGYKVFKINQIFQILIKNFLFYCGKDTHILVVLYHHFYPLDQFNIPGNVKTLAKGFCTQVFISSALIKESCIQI
nr:reverse transcriptase domain-containing protein [Tanacetum cinerariifolium]